jgi:hypothetical protein
MLPEASRLKAGQIGLAFPWQRVYIGMLLEQYSLVIFIAIYFTYALTIRFISIFFFKTCLWKAA